jgi:ribosome-binding protein aMBF1 (putative translation factor)
VSQQARHEQYVRERMKRSDRFRRSCARYGRQVDMAMPVCQMRQAAALSQAELARRIGSTQSAIARIEDAEYTGHSLKLIEKIAAACDVALELRAHRKSNIDLAVSLVA